MDDLSEHIKMMVERLAKIQDRSPTTVGFRVGGHSTLYQRLCAGRPVTTIVAMRVLEEIERQWPDEIPMPKAPFGG